MGWPVSESSDITDIEFQRPLTEMTPTATKISLQSDFQEENCESRQSDMDRDKSDSMINISQEMPIRKISKKHQNYSND